MPVKSTYDNLTVVTERSQVHLGDDHRAVTEGSVWEGCLNSSYIDYSSGPMGSMKSCVHFRARREVHNVNFLALHPWNGYPHFFPLGKDGGSQCSLEYWNSYAYALSGFFTKVATESGVSGSSSHLDCPTPLSSYETRDLILRAVNGLGQPMLDLPLFLYELKDLKGILGSIKRGWASRKLPPGRSLDTIGMKDLASSYLGYEFGLRPLVADIQRIFELLTRFDAKYKQYLKKAKRLNSAHAMLQLDPINTSTESVYGAINTTEQSLERVIRVTVRYRIHSVAGDDLLGRIGFLLESFGIRLSARTVWNAIPFSFLFDWFLNIDSFLNQLDEDLINIEIVDACITYSCQTLRSLESRAPYLYAQKQLAASEDYKIFRRHPIAPNVVAGVLTEEGLVGKRLALSAALLVANSDTIVRSSLGRIDQQLKTIRKRERAARKRQKRFDDMASRAAFRKGRRYGRKIIATIQEP